MEEFRTTLLREKFEIKDPEDINSSAEGIVTALSNRMVVPLLDADKPEHNETFVVRAQNMHTCVRMAAMIAKERYDRGPIMNRGRDFYWDDPWRTIIKGYEEDWNPSIWCVVYYKGRPIFEAGERHPFLDIIEQCDIKSKQDYKDSVVFAEDAFSQAGKKVDIEHDANVALIVSIKEDKSKCGLIIRTPLKTTTFNFTAKPYESRSHAKLKISVVLSVCAAFLEGIQMSFACGLLNKKVNLGVIEPRSKEDQRVKKSNDRLVNLNRAIVNFETTFSVSYRPERPSFVDLTQEAEQFAWEFLRHEIEDMVESEHPDIEGQWII